MVVEGNWNHLGNIGPAGVSPAVAKQRMEVRDKRGRSGDGFARKTLGFGGNIRVKLKRELKK